jgi:uncharacterized RDD family membrane protein YckC
MEPTLADSAWAEAAPAPEPRVGAPPAGFWRRAVAFALDLMLVDLIESAYVAVAVLAVRSAHAASVWEPSGAASMLDPGWAVALNLTIFTAYFTFFHYWGGQTPGKMLLRARVERTDGGPLSPGRALLRSVACLASALTVVGFLMAAVEKRKRALHDLIAGTHVVQV